MVGRLLLQFIGHTGYEGTQLMDVLYYTPLSGHLVVMVSFPYLCMGVILALSLIVLTFLNIVWQWTGPKTWPRNQVGLGLGLAHYHTYRKYTGSPWDTGTSILQTHSGGSYSVHFRADSRYIRTTNITILWLLGSHVRQRTDLIAGNLLLLPLSETVVIRAG